MKTLLPSAVTRRQHTSPRGSHPVDFRPWRWFILSVLLLAAATLGGVFSGVAQAQDANGAINGLTLSSDSPGTLTASWDMPSPAPSDYRVDWAKSSESYRSYKVDEGHVYPEGSVTTVTITDLEAGTEYKVRMRARYNQGEHADSPWSGPWQEASLTVAAEPTPEPTAEPAPEPTAEPTEEPESGAIGSPTATDDNAGGLVIAWEAPQAPHDAPTDYRVNWAKSDDDYPSYAEEHGNAHPATPTHTLEGLDQDTEYKIRIRARYSPNDRYDAHWSGPWTEIRARVVSSPPDNQEDSGAPAAPSLIGTAVTPEGHVTLLWLDPADDSVTGYRVLRGPDADSLAAIREDTGSNAVSYTDTEAGAGQTYTYAVEARNAAGLSPPSNTRTATVPQNEDDDESDLIPARSSHDLDDATLSALTVSPTDIIGFAPDRTSYEVGVASTVTRVTITAAATNSDASVAYSGTDADLATDGRQVDLSAGRNAVTITVTAQDGSATREYTVSVNRGVTGGYRWKAVDDLDGLIAAGNGSPRGIWSDGVTMWVVDAFNAKIHAYKMSDKERDASKDFNTLAGADNYNPEGIWSDGDTIWVADSIAKVYSYNLNTKARDASKDFNTLAGAGNGSLRGIWSDGETMWVADPSDDKLYAYNLNTKTRDASQDFNTLAGAGNNNPTGIWADSVTMWVADWVDDKLYAYNLNTKTRDASKDFPTLAGAGNNSPYGIWSDGATMWVADSADYKVYSYNMPPPAISDVTPNMPPPAISDATTLVTNLDRTEGLPLTVSVNGSRATSFTTAAGPWARYELSGIRIRASRAQVSAQPTPLFTVHRDDGGLPAAAPLYTLDNPSDILSDVDTDYHDYTLTAPAGATLYPGATYWVVFATESGPYLVQATSDTTQTGDGWMIGDLYLFLFGGTWRTVSDTVAQFAVLGTEIDLLETETCTVDTSNSGTAVNILDDRLRAVVEAKLGKSSGATITRGEMAGLTSLLNTHNKELRPTPHAQITDMEGLQYATGLTHLSLQRHRIDNAGLIDFCALTKLTKLFLNNNQLTSITIPSLPRLTSLGLSSNRLDSVTILYTPELTYLDLSSNHLSRVIIPPQPKLLALLLRKNRFTSFTIPSLPELIHLDLARQNPRLRSIAIPRLPNLHLLDLDRNQLSRVDVSNLGWMFAVLDVRHNSGSLTIVGAKSGLTICDGNTTNSICGNANQ